MRDKRGLEASFGWIFAVIVGAIILFLAIYASGRFVKIGRNIENTEIAQEISVLLTPVETNLESGKIVAITLPVESRIFNECDDLGNFGVQRLSVATKSSIGEEWQGPGIPSRFPNKYVFSEKTTEGKELYVLSKPFEFPFKIADLTYIWSDEQEYCFVNPPSEIESEINRLKPKNIVLSSEGNCILTSKKVCFGSSGCDIDVSLDAFSGELRGNVKKKFENSVYFEGSALLYGAIFSDREIYECQIKRLMKRAGELALIYNEKSNYLSVRECGSSSLQTELIKYANGSLIKSSSDLRGLSDIAYELGRANDGLSCKLF